MNFSKTLSIEEKLILLSQGSQFDLSCACGDKNQETHRRRTKNNTWLYPVSLPNGGTSVIFKTLVSNACTNTCVYCPLRASEDFRRCTLKPEEIVSTFLDYYKKKEVFGLFVSSGVTGSSDATMQSINTIASLLRKKHSFKGYIHLKIIPGASDGAIFEALSLASAVSINIEAPGESHFNTLCKNKNYLHDIIRPMKLIHSLTSQHKQFQKIKQTTQFVVGAATETDKEIIHYTDGLYKKLALNRVYFSAYQKNIGAETTILNPEQNGQLLTREHRLYQTDWLIRKYGFSSHEIPFDSQGSLSLVQDPKLAWAEQHPEFFPVNLNKASKYELLRIPGLGLLTVNALLRARKQQQITSLTDVCKSNKRTQLASRYIRFS